MFQLNIKKLLGPVAFLAAMGMAFAFTPRIASKKTAAHDSKAPFVWLKYDCNNPGQVQLTGSTNWTTDLVNPPAEFIPCTGGSPTICAVRVDKADTHEVDGNPDIIDLNEDVELPDPEIHPMDYVYCPDSK